MKNSKRKKFTRFLKNIPKKKLGKTDLLDPSKTERAIKNIKLHRDEDSQEQYFDLYEVLAGTNVNPDDVDTYDLTSEGQSIKLTLYDKDGKQLKVKARGMYGTTRNDC